MLTSFWSNTHAHNIINTHEQKKTSYKRYTESNFQNFLTMLRAHSYNVHHLRILKLIPPSLAAATTTTTSNIYWPTSPNSFHSDTHNKHIQKKTHTHLSRKAPKFMCTWWWYARRTRYVNFPPVQYMLLRKSRYIGTCPFFSYNMK